ncbi:hypothetical protein [Stenotrophomonas cyclobalanopsidis]|uniref:hypothetical protein n=1 Tax=Stenotrophomonas cyclobalanopsidis TaxID=2771362 RepID=UPI0028A7AC66|nr:hypothetical protein [Stenotrophomonas cyclobalanopsidis]
MEEGASKQAYLARRHEYVLKRREALNQNTFKIFSTLQGVLVLLFTGQFYVIRDVTNGALTPQLAFSATIFIGSMAAFSIIAYVLMTIGGMLAWVNYRKEEQDIEGQIGVPPRAMPRFKDVLKWYEFYLLVLVLLFSVGIYFAYASYLMPLVVEKVG